MRNYNIKNKNLKWTLSNMSVEVAALPLQSPASAFSLAAAVLSPSSSTLECMLALTFYLNRRQVEFRISILKPYPDSIIAGIKVGNIN